MAGVVDLDGIVRGRCRRHIYAGREWLNESVIFGGGGGGAGAGAAGGGGRRGTGGGRRRKIWHLENVPEEEKEALKVFVGHLKGSVTNHDLRVAFSFYVKVVNAFVVRDKITKRSKCFGFVTTSTPEEVEKLLQLNNGEVQIHGQSVFIKPARKRNILPGEEGYVRRPVSDRDFELDPEDPTQPSIHMLVDDVLFKIFEYLPIRTLIGVERVCRRWQMIVHKNFAKQTKLDLGKEFTGAYGTLTRPILNKVLILAGLSLKELKVRNIEYNIENLFKIISQLCPVLESLDVIGALGIDSSNIRALTNGCKNLKSFIIKECEDFDSKGLKVILSNYSQLERLHIPRLSFEGREFNSLPCTLKELMISWCRFIKPENLKIIGDRCPNLEVLEMDYTKADRAVLEHIGTHCTKLLELKLCLPNRTCADALLTFKKLKRLDMILENDFENDFEKNFEISAIEHMSDLEQLCLRVPMPQLNSVCSNLKFGGFKKLQILSLNGVSTSSKSLSSIARCTNLKSLKIRSSSMTSSILLDILRGCPQLEKLWSPDIQMSKNLLNSINEIMKPRVGPLSLSLSSDASFDESDLQIDSNKIKFDMSACYRFKMNDFDDELGLDDENESLFSGDSCDDDYWMFAYDSDSSLPDAELYADMDFLDYHLGLFNFNLNDSEDEFMGLAAF